MWDYMAVTLESGVNDKFGVADYGTDLDGNPIGGMEATEMQAVVVPEEQSWVVNGLAAFGLVVMLYGSFRHYTSKNE